MNHTCDKCHERLSAKEERTCAKDNEWATLPSWICADCLFHEENQDYSMDYEQHSDADIGL